jgi:hypothetical protein
MTTLSLADAEVMFSHCILEHEGELVVARDVIDKDGALKLSVRKFGSTKNILLDPDPEAVYCPTNPYRLGYVQYEGAAAYLHRVPRRQYKVGWCENNVNGLHMGHLIRVGATIVDNLKGVYKSFEEALKLSTEGGGIYAFDRQFAVGEYGRVLCYKGQGIANITGNDANLETHGFGHIREWFEKAKG